MKEKYVCDYCGGFEHEVPDPEGGLSFGDRSRYDVRMSVDGALPPDRPAIDVRVCVWCFKKVFDTVLGEPKK